MTVARILTIHPAPPTADKPHALSSSRDYLAPTHFPHPNLSDAALLPIPTLRAAAILLSPSDPLLPDIKAAQLADPALQAFAADLLERPARESNPRPPSGRPSTLYTMRDGLLPQRAPGYSPYYYCPHPRHSPPILRCAHGGPLWNGTHTRAIGPVYPLSWSV